MEKIFNYPFAKDGDRNTTIPEANTQDNSVSMQSGWTLPYELNPANGGKYIERKDMNEILFRAFDGINQVAEAVDKWTRLTTENLNNIKQAGRYFQPLIAQATNERNYPINSAGYLIVINTNISGFAVTQIYKTYNSEKIYIRRTTTGTDWSAWDSFVLTSEFNNRITALQNTDTKLSNNKEDKTKFTNAVVNSTTNSNLDNLTQNGFYWRTANTGNPLPTTNGGAVIVDTNGNQVIQYFYTDIWDATNGGAWFRTRNANNIWTDWHHLENSEHAEATYRKIADSYSKSETNNLLNTKEDKTYYSLSFNPTLNAVKDNRFYEHGTNYTNAFNTQSNYIFNIGAENGSWVRQISFPCASNEIGVRRIQTKDNMNSWGAWDSLMLTSTANSTFRKIADSYTKSEVYTKTQTDSKIIGINQTWQKPSRANNTQYTNNTGKPIMVAITFKSANEHAAGTCDFYVNNLIIASEDQRYIHIGRHAFSFIVPPGATYKVNCTGDFSIYLWVELR